MEEHLGLGAKTNFMICVPPIKSEQLKTNFMVSVPQIKSFINLCFCSSLSLRHFWKKARVHKETDSTFFQIQILMDKAALYKTKKWFVISVEQLHISFKVLFIQTFSDWATFLKYLDKMTSIQILMSTLTGNHYSKNIWYSPITRAQGELEYP